MRTLLLGFLLTACWHEAKPVEPTPQKRPVKDIVQPVYMEKQNPDGVEGGEEGGVVGGDVGDPCGYGVVGGTVAPPPPPPPPPPPSPAQNVAPTVLDSYRIAGDKYILPDDITKTEISRSGKDRVVGSLKLCVDITGKVSSVSQLKSTGYSAYDSKLQNTIRGTWRYKPYEVNGRAVPVCTAVTFIYSQNPPPPPPPPPPTP